MIHDLIVWANCHDWEESIISDISSSFRILAKCTVVWEDEFFDDNLTVFYSKSWQSFSKSKVKGAVISKKEHCGTGPFSLLVFEDPSPLLDMRETSSGKSLVNVNVFERKNRYREMTGGGHMIHASNDESETQRDLTLLLGCNVDDFLKDVSKWRDVRWKHNCTGVGGYSSIRELFYVLNNSISYCVLRNHECLPEAYTVEGHGDIDLLTEHLRQMACLTLAKPIFNESFRVYHTVSIAGKDVPFDFRYVGDNYYDVTWERHILESRRLEKGVFYIPSVEDQYYSLLYHAYIQKNDLKQDYISKLEKYGEAAGVPYNPDVRQAVIQLDTFMGHRGYEYMEPTDKTVVFNLDNLSYSDYAFRLGKCIKRTEEGGSNGFVYSSRVYKKDKTYIKVGTPWLIENEAVLLKEVSGHGIFPEVVAYKKIDEQTSLLEITDAGKEDAGAFFSNMNNQHSRIVRSFARQVISALKILRDSNISHRDLTPSNILVSRIGKDISVGITDFGWAVHTDAGTVGTPANLGGRYAMGNSPSDCYAVGKLFMEYWPDIPYIRLLSSYLFKGASSETDRYLKKSSRLLRLPFMPHDELRMLIRRHWRISQLKNKIWTRFLIS